MLTDIPPVSNNDYDWSIDTFNSLNWKTNYFYFVVFEVWTSILTQLKQTDSTPFKFVITENIIICTETWNLLYLVLLKGYIVIKVKNK